MSCTYDDLPSVLSATDVDLKPFFCRHNIHVTFCNIVRPHVDDRCDTPIVAFVVDDLEAGSRVGRTLMSGMLVF